MPTKTKLIVFLLFLSGGMIRAQERNVAKIPPADAIQRYLSETGAYAALYNGKVVTPYERPFVNSPFFESTGYIEGELCYNEVVYQDILMCLDLYRDELTVFLPQRPFHIVLESEKFNYAVLNGSVFIESHNYLNIRSKYVMLIKDGLYPIVKQYRGIVREEDTNLKRERYVRFQEQYFITVNGIAYPVKNKNALLKLFPDRKKELNDFVKQRKLSFRSQQFEQSLVALVYHYENLINRTQMTQMTQISANKQ